MGIVEFAEFIKKRIKETGQTKKELAQKSGLSRSLIYKILNYELTTLSESTLRKLAFMLGVTSAELHSLLWKGTLGVKQNAKSNNLVSGDESIFIKDVTYADNEIIHINQDFIKIWELRNIGNVAWKDRFLKRIDSPDGDGALICASDFISIPLTQPGENVQVAIKFTAPPYPCSTISYWKMMDKDGNFCFPDKKGLWCRVMVNIIGL